MSRRSQKFSAYDFDEDDIEKHSRQILKKFYPTSPKKTATRDAPIDKYTFLTHFCKDKKDQDKKCGYDLVDIDPAIEVEKRCTSTDCLDNHSARCCLPEVNSYSSRDLKIGASTSSNCRDDTNHNFPSERELIGITSDDDNDSIELNSTLRSNSHFVDNEELSTEEVLVGGVNTGGSDMEIALLPKYILNGDKKFLNPRLTFSGNHVKLEVGGSILSSGPLSCVWTVSEIFSIESWWFERHSVAALLLHLKSKDTELGIIAEEPDIVKLNWKVTHPCWPKIQDKIWALNDGYKYTWNTNSHVAPNTEDVLSDKVSVHPTHGLSEFVEFSFPKGDLHAVFIGWSDIQLLQPRSFINDTIIDFYMKYLETKVRREEAARFHFFNSFFFRKLADLDGDLSCEEGKAAFLRVRKWTRKLDLFEKDYIFIPVNFSCHWSLIVICQPAEVVNFKDNEMENLCKVPCILHMDSIRGSHRGLEKLFKSYLLQEWKERHNNSVEDICTRFWDMPFISLELPQQENLFDCGLFLLHYTELFIEEAPENFNPFKIPESSNFLRKQWFTPAEASSKRTFIRDLIYRIAGDHTLDVCASDISSPSDSAEVYECNIGGQFRSGIDTSTDKCMLSRSDCSSDQKFDTKPVTAALDILQFDGEPKMNNDEILDPRYHTRSPSDRYCHPAISYNQSKSIMSPIEEHEDSEEEKSATLYRDKEVMATESKLLPGIYVDRENIKKQGILQGTFGSEPCIMLETTVSEAQKSAVLDSDVKEHNEIPSTTSDELTTCIVEDSEEVCEIQSDNECQSCANNRNEDSSSDQQFNPVATSLPLYCDKEVLAIESKLLPGIYIDRENIKKQDILQGTFGSEPCIILKTIVSEAQKSAVLDLDVKEHNEIPSTTSDEFAACIVEDSEEVCEIQSDNECQSCANNQNENSSSDRQSNPIATSLPLEHILNVGLSHSVVSDFELQQLKTPETVDIGSPLHLSNQESNFIEIADFTEKNMGSPLHPGVTPVLSDQEIDFIEIADSTKRNTKDQQSAKRPRNMLVDEEEPLSKRLETIVID